MSNEAKVSKWLRDNTELSWSRTKGDSPAVKLDRLYINRSEAYEIRDFILTRLMCNSREDTSEAMSYYL